MLKLLPIDVHHDLCWVRGADLDRHFSARLKLRDVDHRDDGLRLNAVGRPARLSNFQVECDLGLVVQHHTGLLHAHDLGLRGDPVLQHVTIRADGLADEADGKDRDPDR